MIRSDVVNQWDHHWMTYQRLCHPCHIRYDFIAKLETMQTDARVLLSIVGVDPYQRGLPKPPGSDDDQRAPLQLVTAPDNLPEFKNGVPSLNSFRNVRRRKNHRTSLGFGDVSLTEFNELSHSERVKIESMYKRDIDMFGYAWDGESGTAKCLFRDVRNVNCC